MFRIKPSTMFITIVVLIIILGNWKNTNPSKINLLIIKAYEKEMTFKLTNSSVVTFQTKDISLFIDDNGSISEYKVTHKSMPTFTTPMSLTFLTYEGNVDLDITKISGTYYQITMGKDTLYGNVIQKHYETKRRY